MDKINRINKFIRKKVVKIIICWTIGSLVLISYFLYKSHNKGNKKNNYNVSWIFIYIIIALVIIGVTFLAHYEFKKANQYMLNLWEHTLFFMSFVSIFSYCDQSSISVYISKGDQSKVFCFLVKNLVLVIALWCAYYSTGKESMKKIKNIDLTELKLIFLKSVFQSLVYFIGLFGLSSVGLRNSLLLLVLIIEIYIFFIFPILDINKYVREKEIEQLKDKNKTNIYFFK